MRSVLAAAALLILSAGAALAAAGTVVGLCGACTVERGGSRNPLALGMGLEVGDTVAVPEDGKLKLRMADGSIVALAAGTTLTIATYATTDAGQRQDAKLSLGQGLVRSIVSHAQPAAGFEIDTAVGTAAARSTDWFVETSASSDRIGVFSGSVTVTSRASGHSVTVPAQRSTILQGGHDPLPPRLLTRAASARIIDRTAIAERGSRAGKSGARPAPHERREHRPGEMRPGAEHRRPSEAHPRPDHNPDMTRVRRPAAERKPDGKDHPSGAARPPG